MPTTLHDLTGDRTMLVLLAAPGDESAACGTLIAEACARGRPPMVAVLTDGATIGAPGLSADGRAAAHARETRAAVAALGLPPGRLLMLGVRDGAVPAEGAFFDQIVDAVAFLTWMRDLNVICAPAAQDARPMHARTGAVAASVVRRTGIAGLTYDSGAPALAASHAVAKARAVAAHVSLLGMEVRAERFAVWHGG